MNNNTKVRLHLSKQLFESLTREIIKEAKKANDGYTVAVKQPKMPKQSQSQAVSPEVQKTDAEAKTESASTQTASTSTLAKDLRQKAQQVVTQSGVSSKEIQGLQKLINTILSKASGGELGVAIDKAQRVLDMSTKNVQPNSKQPAMSTTPGMKEMETKVAEEGIEEGYYDDIKGYTSASDNGTGFKDNDRVKSKSTGQEGVVYDTLKSTDGKALVVVKFEKNGQKTISKYGEEFNDIADIEKK